LVDVDHAPGVYQIAEVMAVTEWGSRVEFTPLPDNPTVTARLLVVDPIEFQIVEENPHNKTNIKVELTDPPPPEI